MSSFFDKKLDKMLNKIMRKEDIAKSKTVKPNGKQIDMFEGEKYLDRFTTNLRRQDGGPGK